MSEQQVGFVCSAMLDPASISISANGTTATIIPSTEERQPNPYPITHDYGMVYDKACKGFDFACKIGYGTPYVWGTCGMYIGGSSDRNADVGVYINIHNGAQVADRRFSDEDLNSREEFIKFCNEKMIDFIDPFCGNDTIRELQEKIMRLKDAMKDIVHTATHW